MASRRHDGSPCPWESEETRDGLPGQRFIPAAAAGSPLGRRWRNVGGNEFPRQGALLRPRPPLRTRQHQESKTVSAGCRRFRHQTHICSFAHGRVKVKSRRAAAVTLPRQPTLTCSAGISFFRGGRLFLLSCSSLSVFDSSLNRDRLPFSSGLSNCITGHVSEQRDSYTSRRRLFRSGSNSESW